MTTFRPPYPLLWDSPIAQQGSPGIGSHGIYNPTGRLYFGMSTNLSNPSSAFLIHSFGMDAGVPSRAGLSLVITPLVDYSGFFYSQGTFASALTSAIIKVYIEESDERNNFVRGIDGTPHVILRQDPAWFYGSQTWTPVERGITPSQPAIPVQANHSYRVFIDLHGEIRAAGYGGFGGSYSHADCQVRVIEVDVDFVRV